MSGSLQRRLVHQASAPYRPAGPWAWRFARGKLGGDPLFAALLGPGLLPASGRYLDLGCGQGLLASWLHAAATLHAGPDWPAAQAAPPRISAYHGLDMQAAAIGHARQALAGCDFPVRLELGDLRDSVLPEADVITLFDVLHYLPSSAQEELLRRIRSSLAANGRLLLRVGDGAAGLPHHLSRIVDSLVVRAQGGAWPRLHCRPVAAWQALLGELGFHTEPCPMAGAGFANVLLHARPR